MSGRLLPGLAVLLLAGAAPAAEPKGDTQDVVLLVPGRPVLLRLRLTTDGQPFRAAHKAAAEDYFAGLFKYLDANGDGALSEAEARRMPPPFKLHPEAGALGVNVAFNYRVVDDDGDGKISPAELALYQLHFAGGPLQVQPSPRPLALQQAGSALFDRIDSDRNGELSKAELTAAVNVLETLDLDRDELLSPQELTNTATVMAARPGLRAATQTSVFALNTPEDRADLAKILLARYGVGNRAKRENLGLDQDAFGKLDADRDGSLDATELARFTDRPADLELIARLGKRGQGEKALEVVQSEGKKPLSPGKDGMLRLSLGGAEIELRVNEDRPAETASARRSLLDAFRSAAGNNPLTPRTARLGDFHPAHFGLLDRDGDGKVTDGELKGYLAQVQDRQAALIAATPALAVLDRPAGLFEMLDRDGDGRLSLRELRAAPELFPRLGRAPDRLLSRGDMRPSYQVSLGLGQASFARAGGMMTPREMPLLTLDWSRADLVWFTRMDRNRDGDLSPREFLGPRKRFTQLDEDGDGLVSAQEALRAPSLPRD